MNTNKNTGSSQSANFRQLFDLFKETQPSETSTKTLLFLVSVVFTPVTLLGALIGFKRAWRRFGLPQGEQPSLADPKPIMWVGMLIGAIMIWILILILMAVLTTVTGTFFGGGIGAQTIIIIILVNLMVSFVIFRSFTRWQAEMSNYIAEAGRFGTSTFATDEDLADLKGQKGLYIGGGVYAYTKQGHKLTAGGARGGKGATIIMNDLLGLTGYEGSWFVIDVKGELAAVSARYQRSKGQNVVILDPWGLNTEKGASYNPLDLIADQSNADNLIDDISIIAEMIVPKETGGDQFWTNKARSLISGMILHMTVTHPKEERSFGKIWKWLRLPQDQFDELLTDMAISDSEIVRATSSEYLGLLQTAPKMFQSILSAAQEKTDFLKSPALQKSLAQSSFDIKNLTNGKTTLYVIIPADKLDSHYQWLRLVMTTALRSAVRRKNKRTTFLLDEFAALGYLPEIRTALSTYAGYNITIWTIVQDLGQIKNLYGDTWETFISNTAVRQFLSVSDVFSLEYLSSLIGTTTKVTYDDKGSAHATSRPLVTPDEVRRASANNIFALIEQRPVATFPKIPYYEIPALNGTYDENPYHKS